MTKVLKSALAVAFAIVGLVCLPAIGHAAGDVYKLALQISDNDKQKMNTVLNVAANVSRYYSDKGDEVQIEIVAFNAGLHMLRADTSPVRERVPSGNMMRVGRSSRTPRWVSSRVAMALGRSPRSIDT